jgi:hypothetical protein
MYNTGMKYPRAQLEISPLMCDKNHTGALLLYSRNTYSTDTGYMHLYRNSKVTQISSIAVTIASKV